MRQSITKEISDVPWEDSGVSLNTTGFPSPKSLSKTVWDSPSQAKMLWESQDPRQNRPGSRDSSPKNPGEMPHSDDVDARHLGFLPKKY